MKEYPLYVKPFEYVEKALDYIPIGWLASKLEDRWGELGLRDKLLSEAEYTFGSAMIGGGIYQAATHGDPWFLSLSAAGLCFGSVGVLHQKAMGRKDNK